MSNFQETLEEFFVENLDYEFIGQELPTPELDGNENILNYSKEYHGNGLDIIVVECSDRIVEFQKKLIKSEKTHFPNAHFLFVSNNGKVFDLYNNATSKKLKKITYDEIGRNTRLFKEKLQLFEVSNASDSTELQINAEKAFDTSDKITKKFFDKFKKIHTKLQKAIGGIDDEKDKSWYASVMMNRIMFIYFLQKHYVIQDNSDFLLQKFDEVNANGKDYYKEFLLPLFFYGFARRDGHPEKEKFVAQYGSIRYLNGGLFYPHHLEKKYTIANPKKELYNEPALQTKISIDAKLIREILEFLNGYTWYLDNRPMKEDTDINPDVLGYIFEKYINQKELGAYYTKEDITEYISKNTIIPFIFDKMNENGFKAPDPNPLITSNEDVIGAIGDYIDSIDDFNEVKFLYKDVLLELSVLDPSVGSGAFLFAALNILLPIYQKTVFKLKEFDKTKNDSWLDTTLNTIKKHPEEYFLTKQIILNNLYGVDIVEEATEICKLRLFLQLASHLPDIKSIEPLPDIDFNIYAGNSLVGGLSWDDIEYNYKSLFNKDGEAIDPKVLKEKIEQLTDLKQQYRSVQQDDDNEEELNKLKDSISFLDTHVNNEIDLDIDNPFHWFIDFNSIINKGGFDVIIGNPPYVEYSKVKKTANYEVVGYATIKSANLYAYFNERSIKLLNKTNGRLGFIEPISLICTKRMLPAQNNLLNNSESLWISCFAERPSKLFTGADLSLVIILNKIGNHKNLYSTRYLKWSSENREELFDSINYIEVSSLKKEYSIPKISTVYALNILEKINKQRNQISNYTVNNSKFYLVYRNAGGRYYKIILPFEPKFYINGEEKTSSTYKKIYFKDEKTRDAICALMNSTLFFWYWIVYSDTWHMVNNDILPFSIDLNQNLIDKLGMLHKELLMDFDSHAEEIEEFRNKGKDLIKYKKFYARNSKKVIDKIDYLLGNHFNLTSQETEFIINYDIEYRDTKE
ncbi:Eco57I restriction-modification methylase domain-containing protein [Corallibacter sp.]|uniref:Eco57I restriction-modification methylase domain-containing protein n=1 Tax=Corallibacter sp. TaxID=2038084 RepID=UPI003AB30396